MMKHWTQSVRIFALIFMKCCILLLYSYRWTKNGINFNISDFGNKFLQLSDEGTIVNNAPEEEDEGIYQCMAENEFGTSISNNVRLRQVQGNY